MTPPGNHILPHYDAADVYKRQPSGFHDLTDQLEGRPAALLPGASGDSLVIATDTDKLLYFCLLYTSRCV